MRKAREAKAEPLTEIGLRHSSDEHGLKANILVSENAADGRAQLMVSLRGRKR